MAPAWNTALWRRGEGRQEVVNVKPAWARQKVYTLVCFLSLGNLLRIEIYLTHKFGG